MVDLVLVDSSHRIVHRYPSLVIEQGDPVRVSLQFLEDVRGVGRAPLEDLHEAGPLVGVRRLQRLIEVKRVPVHGPGHERGVGHAQGGLDDVERREHGAPGMGVGGHSLGAGG